MLALRLVIDTDVLVSAALKPDAVPARLVDSGRVAASAAS
jgi:predicted nucleic acid-binding protein